MGADEDEGEAPAREDEEEVGELEIEGEAVEKKKKRNQSGHSGKFKGTESEPNPICPPVWTWIPTRGSQ